jgi:18S rRNA (guanine1575-N7)-methyltransferase
LDVGCGSGLSGEVLTEKGHLWTGVDISPSMLGVAVQREVEGDLVEADMGDGMFFQPGVFDGCVSISALQWLCQSDRRSDVPRDRLKRFFVSLYECLAGGARAVFQFYPETDQQLKLIMDSATRSGFNGGLVVDYPNSRAAKKYFLCLVAGEGDIQGRGYVCMCV